MYVETKKQKQNKQNKQNKQTNKKKTGVFWGIWSKNSGSLACLCITDSLSHTMYVETKKKKQKKTKQTKQTKRKQGCSEESGQKILEA